MKAVTKTLQKFLELVNVSGAVDMKECILKGTKETLQVYAKTPSNTFALKATLKGDYSELETIGIDDLALLRKVVALNKDVAGIDITKKENTIVFKEKKAKTKLLLRNPKYILTALDSKAYEEKRKIALGNEFTLKKEDINTIAKYYEVMKGKIHISGNKNTITLKMGLNENASELKIDIKEEVKPFELAIAGFFVEALVQVNSDVLISANTDKPLLVNIKDDDYEIEYFLAPLKREKEKSDE